LNPDSPSLSVIVPVYNGSRTLERCLSALAASTFRDFETLVVDDGSSDASAAIAQSFGVRLIRLKRNSGPAAARNAGVAASSAPLLFFLDADVVIPPSFLERAMETLGGRPEFSGLFCSYCRGTALNDTCSRHKNLLHHWTHQTASPEAVTFCGGFGLLRRAAFLEVGGFDPRRRFLEDVDLGYRLHRAGHRILLAKDLQATHAKAYTLASLLRSDVFERAAPWTRLMLTHRIFRNDLNTRVHNVLSVIAACLMPLSIVLDPRLRVAAVLAAMFLWLNRSFLRLGLREYGFVFAVRSAGLCWLSYIASAAGACLGAGAWLRQRYSSGARGLLAPSSGS
jgi:GT2 family glycosyltransferase